MFVDIVLVFVVMGGAAWTAVDKQRKKGRKRPEHWYVHWIFIVRRHALQYGIHMERKRQDNK